MSVKITHTGSISVYGLTIKKSYRTSACVVVVDVMTLPRSESIIPIIEQGRKFERRESIDCTGPPYMTGTCLTNIPDERELISVGVEPREWKKSSLSSFFDLFQP